MKNIALALLSFFPILISTYKPVYSSNRLSYVSYNENRGEFDTSLFYGNTKTMKGADPSLIYVEPIEGDEDTGYYYAYVTATSTINTWRTKDMTNWQFIGATFRPNLDRNWAYTNFWAPSVIYDQSDLYYYMFYSATWYKYSSSHYMSVARSKSPAGPFIELGDGSAPLINFNNVPKDNPLFEYQGNSNVYQDGYFSCIDGEAFIDPVSKKKYLLFVHDKGAGYSYSSIYTMEMESWTKPKYETITRLTECEYLEVGGTKKIDDATVNEGPFMYYHNGLYYLTFSTHIYSSPSYQVRQAVSHSPMGPFKKVEVEKGGTIITTDGISIYTSSSGHHSFIDIGDELYIGYHTFYNDTDISEARKIKFDKVEFVTNQDGLEVMYANGPTVSLQPIPSKISNYENKARNAHVFASNVEDSSSKYWLNDGTIQMHEESLVKETMFSPGNSSITLTWDDYVDAKAIMVYNSRDFNSAFTKIDNILIHFKGKDGKKYTCDTGEIAFNFSIYSSLDFKLMFAGASSSIQFDNLNIDRLDIFFSSSNGGASSPIGVSEVVVLGRVEK